MNGGVLAIAAFATTATCWGMWWQKIQALTIPRAPHGFRLAHGIAIILAVAVIIGSGGALAKSLAVVAILGSAMWLYFSFTNAMDHKIPSVKVGDAIVSFSAPDADGNDFNLASLEGKPFLLKFFRGFW